MINYPYITEYIRENTPKLNGILAELEDYAWEHHVPISQPETLRFIEILAAIHKPRKILEIGTAIGYFAIAMAINNEQLTMNSDGGNSQSEFQIVTIEKSEDMANIARGNISAAGLDSRIEVITGDAKDVLPTLEDGEFDLIFLDAAKGQYLQFLPHCVRVLRNGGVLVSDNVLFDGMVATDELWKKRKCTIIRNLREYIKEIMDNDKLKTAVIPIGDGVAVSYKNN